MSELKWRGKEAAAKIARAIPRGLEAACVVVEAQVKINLYNVVYSTPEPANYKRTGNLGNAWAHQVFGKHAQVGTPVEYAVYIEYGTSRMAARPVLRPAVDEHQPEILKAFANEIRKVLA